MEGGGGGGGGGRGGWGGGGDLQSPSDPVKSGVTPFLLGHDPPLFKGQKETAGE